MYSIAPSPTPTLLSDPVTSAPPDTSAPSILRYIISFLLIGIAWGFTTPFIRAAARTHQPPSHPILSSPSVTNSFLKSKLYSAFFGVVDLLRNPRYAIPLVVNLTGSIWFFLLIGQAGESDFLVLCFEERWGRGIDDVDDAKFVYRTLIDSPHYKLPRFSLHRTRRMVGRKESDQSRYLDWYDLVIMWYRTLCP